MVAADNESDTVPSEDTDSKNAEEGGSNGGAEKITRPAQQWEVWLQGSEGCFSHAASPAQSHAWHGDGDSQLCGFLPGTGPAGLWDNCPSCPWPHVRPPTHTGPPTNKMAGSPRLQAPARHAGPSSFSPHATRIHSSPRSTHTLRLQFLHSVSSLPSQPLQTLAEVSVSLPSLAVRGSPWEHTMASRLLQASPTLRPLDLRRSTVTHSWQNGNCSPPLPPPRKMRVPYREVHGEGIIFLTKEHLKSKKRMQGQLKERGTSLANRLGEGATMK